MIRRLDVLLSNIQRLRPFNSDWIYFLWHSRITPKTVNKRRSRTKRRITNGNTTLKRIGQSELPFASLLKRVVVQNNSHENVFRLQVHFQATNHFHRRCLHKDSLWGTRHKVNWKLGWSGSDQQKMLPDLLHRTTFNALSINALLLCNKILRRQDVKVPVVQGILLCDGYWMLTYRDCDKWCLLTLP